MKFSVFILLSAGIAISNCSAPQPVTDAQAIEQLRNFYVYYLTESGQIGKEHYRGVDSLLAKYSTVKLTEQLKAQDEAGYDFIANTNGHQIEAAKTVKVLKDENEKDIYIVSFSYLRPPPEPDEVNTLRLRLIKTPSGILIDEIVSSSP